MANPYESPHAPPPYDPRSAKATEGDSTGGVIPYKNPHALMAYYFSIGTILCCVTPLPLGLLPLVLGIIGLMKRNANPIIKGSVHAWIGIVLGGLSAICSFLVIVGLIIGALNS
jgi:hypothetical protein